MSILQTRWRRIGMSRQSANLLLLLVAMSWGLSYVLLKMGATKLPPFEVLALRFTFASIACIAVFWRRLLHTSRRAVLMLSESMSGQAICGAVLVLASVLLTTYRRPKHK